LKEGEGVRRLRLDRPLVDQHRPKAEAGREEGREGGREGGKEGGRGRRCLSEPGWAYIGSLVEAHITSHVCPPPCRQAPNFVPCFPRHAILARHNKGDART
jgi:hypothetical protein